MILGIPQFGEEFGVKYSMETDNGCHGIYYCERLHDTTCYIFSNQSGLCGKCSLCEISYTADHEDKIITLLLEHLMSPSHNLNFVKFEPPERLLKNGKIYTYTHFADYVKVAHHIMNPLPSTTKR